MDGMNTCLLSYVCLHVVPVTIVYLMHVSFTELLCSNLPCCVFIILATCRWLVFHLLVRLRGSLPHSFACYSSNSRVFSSCHSRAVLGDYIRG